MVSIIKDNVSTTCFVFIPYVLSDSLVLRLLLYWITQLWKRIRPPLLTYILWVIPIVLPNSNGVSTYPIHFNCSVKALPSHTELKWYLTCLLKHHFWCRRYIKPIYPLYPTFVVYFTTIGGGCLLHRSSLSYKKFNMLKNFCVLLNIQKIY